MGNPGFEFRHGREIFHFSKTSRTALELQKPPIPFVPGLFSVNKSGRNVKPTTVLPLLQRLRLSLTPVYLLRNYLWRSSKISS
jgi:hypothetical protein